MTPTASQPTSRLAARADLAFRRRRRMVLAWIVALAAVIAVAPRIALDRFLPRLDLERRPRRRSREHEEHEEHDRLRFADGWERG